MKKIIVLITCIFLLTSCNNKKEEIKDIPELYATYNSIELRPGTLFTNIIATLGKPNNTRTEPSTYIEGEATIYEYDNFEIETYFEDNIEKIYSIKFTNEEQLTNENIKLGDTKEKMISVYGKQYQNIDDIIFVYTISNTSLSFTIENDIIIEIIYSKI